jgi:hypothetical protein
MTKKTLKKTAKVLGGLGAAYLASGYIRPGVQPEDVNKEDAAADAAATRARVEANRVDKRPAPESVDKRPAPESVDKRPAPEPVQPRNKYKDIAADEFMAGSRSYGQGPANAYKRLQEASASGAYASPVLNRGESGNRIPAGDLGQFLKKGGVVSASRRGDGVAQRGKTRGKMV